MADGRLVDATKECVCCTHSGPHWLHPDELWKARNKALARVETTVGVIGYIQEKRVRLQAKLHEMRSRGIVEIVRE